jgi:hypothetical protein
VPLMGPETMMASAMFVPSWRPGTPRAGSVAAGQFPVGDHRTGEQRPSRPGVGNWQLTKVPPWLWCYLRKPILAMIVRYRSTSFFLT